MMNRVTVADGVYWVGAVDWNARHFHGYTYTTHRGTSYNAYLIVADKIALVDTVHAPFTNELLSRIREIVPPESIDYVIANHVEVDHSGAMPSVMEAAPKAKVYCSAKGKEGLFRYYQRDWDYVTVKTGDELDLGGKTLRFVEAPMLHWPDSMFTYLKEEALLMPNDAFGQHLASSVLFDDLVDPCVLMAEAVKYYANILAPFGPLVLKKIEEVSASGIEIKTIAPSHGIIWRKDPGKIVNAYLSWAKGEAAPRAVIAYDTMWGSTEKLAMAIAEGIQAEGVEVRVFKISESDRSDVLTEAFQAKGLLVGASTIHRDYLPTMAPFLDELIGLKFKGKVAAAFGSYGWSKGAVANLEEKLKKAGLDVIESGPQCQYTPTAEELASCVEFGKRFAQAIK